MRREIREKEKFAEEFALNKQQWLNDLIDLTKIKSWITHFLPPSLITVAGAYSYLSGRLSLSVYTVAGFVAAFGLVLYVVHNLLRRFVKKNVLKYQKNYLIRKRKFMKNIKL